MKIWGLPNENMQKLFFLIKTGHRLWTSLYTSTGSNNGQITSLWLVRIGAIIIVIILILETSIKITKMRIMRWGADKRCLCESRKDYATIEYQIVIDEKAGVIETKTKIL